jgi:diguanylate cyclase (GGDEF)-like protein
MVAHPAAEDALLLEQYPHLAPAFVDLHDLELEIVRRQMHDDLTGLPNRALVVDRCTQMMERSLDAGTRVAALIVDIDDFGEVNDDFGHVAGDAMMVAVASRLVACVRADDIVGRLGSDEFVVLCEYEESGWGPESLAERLHEVFDEPFCLGEGDDVRILLRASIGIAQGPREVASELLRDSHVALNQAKALGKNRSVVFDNESYTALKSRVQLENDLRVAISARQFFLVYQPTVDLMSQEVAGVEALVRWRHPTRGVVMPSEFVPVLEETGAIVDVGKWILREACTQAAAWQRRGLPLTMSVNLSARQLDSDELFSVVREALESSGLHPKSLTVEITETALVRDTANVAERLGQIHDLGVSVAIDDFGTGYCSLGYLQNFPLDVLKIDRGFVAGLGVSEDARILVRTLVQLGKDLGLLTLAEGIETEAQLTELLRLGCQAGQGYLFARPMERAALEDLVRLRRREALAGVCLGGVSRIKAGMAVA